MATHRTLTLLRHLVAACALLAFSTPHAHAIDVYVVANVNDSVSALSRSEAVDLFMGRSRHFANGQKMQAFDLARGTSERETFYRLLTGMDMAQVNSYWARLTFSGQTTPPQSLANELAMAELIKRTPGAIGYLTHPPADKSLTVLLVLKDGK